MDNGTLGETVDGKDAWGEIEPGKWIALAFKGEKYVDMM